jgi:putative Mn2+ efflux pump MntP
MYGLRKIRIPLLSIAIISVCSGFVIFASMQIGAFAARYLPPAFAKATGAVILIGIGVWAIIQMWRQRQDSGQDSLTPATADQTVRMEAGAPGVLLQAEAKQAQAQAQDQADEGGIRTVLRIEMKRIGLVIEILRTPSLADVDRSGYISSSEAVLLGVALSLDAFGAGIGAAFIGFAPVLTAAVIAVASGLFITLGLRVGLTFADTRWLQRLAVLPGCILIAMGIMKLM